MVDVLCRNWGWVVLRGLVALFFGLFTFLNPFVTLTVLVLLFGAYAFVDGIFALTTAITNRHGEPRWVALFVTGILGILAGIVTLVFPGITTVVLLAVIATWAILTGIATIVAAIRLRKSIAGEWMLVVDGLLALALGLILIMAPGAGALGMILWIGAYAIASGTLLIALGFRLRTWGHTHHPGATPHPV